MASYEVLVGLDYVTPRGPRRAEPGEVVDDLPEKSLPWLLEQGCIRKPPSRAVGAPAAEAAAKAED